MSPHPKSSTVGVTVDVRVPASSANLGPGFDSVGLALGIWDRCVATVVDEPGLVIDIEGEGAADVPRDATNLVHRALQTALAGLGVDPPAGLRLACHNGVPHGRGLGSSAAAIVTGIVVAQGIAAAEKDAEPGPIDLDYTNTLAARLEGHPDNSSASVYGGLTISFTDDADPTVTHTARPRLHPDVEVVVAVPTAQLSTARARSMLPAQVRLADAARNSGRAALLVHALGEEPAYLFAATREWLHQEPRRASYAASMSLVDHLRAHGHAAVISGAGPAVLVLTHRDGIDAVVDLIAADWQVLRPGVPSSGAEVDITRS